jgi:hypothetical protein
MEAARSGCHGAGVREYVEVSTLSKVECEWTVYETSPLGPEIFAQQISESW